MGKETVKFDLYTTNYTLDGPVRKKLLLEDPDTNSSDTSSTPDAYAPVYRPGEKEALDVSAKASAEDFLERARKPPTEREPLYNRRGQQIGTRADKIRANYMSKEDWDRGPGRAARQQIEAAQSPEEKAAIARAAQLREETRRAKGIAASDFYREDPFASRPKSPPRNYAAESRAAAERAARTYDRGLPRQKNPNEPIVTTRDPFQGVRSVAKKLRPGESIGITLGKPKPGRVGMVANEKGEMVPIREETARIAKPFKEAIDRADKGATEIAGTIQRNQDSNPRAMAAMQADEFQRQQDAKYLAKQLGADYARRLEIARSRPGYRRSRKQNIADNPTIRAYPYDPYASNNINGAKKIVSR